MVLVGLDVVRWRDMVPPEVPRRRSREGVVGPIRTAQLSDVSAIVAVEAESFDARMRWSEEDLRSEVGQGHVIVVEADGDVVGYCSFRVRDGDGRIDSVAVMKSWQGNGFGKKLVLQSLKEMFHVGAEFVELDCHESLDGFYSQMGFDRCGTYTTGIGERQVRRLVMRWVP